ncbi:phasin family protein [Chitinimonas koreensis]|uniref:phasin family protein n=1 Tax=Chitinimonas koreensis TaxID=356302 RepID=UPI0004213508|nr:phasin family protein [Chitinimonas koreensis]QNM94936.1 TIGR01841 family phasin [Chitinimonas koreensis]
MTQVPYSDLTQQQLETAIRVAHISLAGAERVLRLQFEAAKEALEQSAQSAAKLADATDVQSALAIRTEVAEQSIGSLLGLSRHLYELASQTQAEFAKLAEERTGAYQKSLLNSLESLGNAAPAGSDVASSLFKSTLSASQAAFDSLSKAAKQVTEFADASVKAATTATTDAVQKGTRAGR